MKFSEECSAPNESNIIDLSSKIIGDVLLKKLYYAKRKFKKERLESDCLNNENFLLDLETMTATLIRILEEAFEETNEPI